MLAPNYVSSSGPLDHAWNPWGFSCWSDRNQRYVTWSVTGSWRRSWSYPSLLLRFFSVKIHLRLLSTRWEGVGLIGYRQYYCPSTTRHRVATFCVRRIYVRTCLSPSSCTRISRDLYQDRSNCIISYQCHSFSTLLSPPALIAHPCTPSPWLHNILFPWMTVIIFLED